MKLIALFFAALLATSYANQATLQGLTRINSDPTGAAILSAISLNLRAKTPISEISDLLSTILNNHLAQAQDLEAKANSKIDRLNAAITDSQALSKSYQNAISTLSNTVDTSQSTLDDDKQQLVKFQEALTSEQTDISNRDADAAEQLPELDDDIVGFSSAIQACGDAISKVRTYEQSNENAASFIQIGTGVRDKLQIVVDTISGMKKKLAKHSNMFTPLTRELIDLSSTLSQTKSKQVIDLLTQLLGILNNAKTQTENTRASYATNYENQQAQSKQKVDDYESRIAQLNEDISSLNDKINQAQQFLQQNQDNLKSNLANIQASQDQLEAAQADLSSRKQKYEKLIGYIRDAANYFAQNFADVDNFVSTVVNGSQ